MTLNLAHPESHLWGNLWSGRVLRAHYSLQSPVRHSPRDTWVLTHWSQMKISLLHMCWSVVQVYQTLLTCLTAQLAHLHTSAWAAHAQFLLYFSIHWSYQYLFWMCSTDTLDLASSIFDVALQSGSPPCSISYYGSHLPSTWAWLHSSHWHLEVSISHHAFGQFPLSKWLPHDDVVQLFPGRGWV